VPRGRVPSITEDGAEPVHEDSRRETHPPVSKATRNWADRDEEEAPDYQEKVFWEPDNCDTLKISATMAKIVKDAFSRSLKPNKKKEIKRKQLIPDTPVPKLDPMIQSLMIPAAKTADRGLAGL